MKTQTTQIKCNNHIISEHTLIPETIWEKFMGLRNKHIEINDAMLFKVKSPLPELFDSFFCEPIRYIATDIKGNVLKTGIMKSNKIMIVKCAYWLELHPERIYEVNTGDIITGLN